MDTYYQIKYSTIKKPNENRNKLFPQKNKNKQYIILNSAQYHKDWFVLN